MLIGLNNVSALSVTRNTLTTNFKGGTSPRINPWNQSQIANRKSSSPRIYPWVNLKSQI